MMDDIRQTAIDRFRAYLERRQFSVHTIVSYTLDLRLFFTEVAIPLGQVSFREVDRFVESQHQHGRAWATINRRLNALKHFFDFCLEQQFVGGNPVKPSHLVAYLRLALRRESSMEECRKTSGIQVPDEPLELSAIDHSM